MKRSVPSVVLLAAVALVALLVYGVVQRKDDRTLDKQVREGKLPTAPDLGLARPMLGADGTRTLASLHGKVVVLNFWASWCDPCREEAPALQAAQARLTKDGSGTVLGATFNDTPTDSLSFVRSQHVGYPIVRDVGTTLAQAYGTRGLPETFVLDRQGRIVSISRGKVTRAFLDQAITRAEQQ